MFSLTLIDNQHTKNRSFYFPLRTKVYVLCLFFSIGYGAGAVWGEDSPYKTKDGELESSSEQAIKVSPTWKCDYYGKEIKDELWTFASDVEAQTALKRILRATGIKPNFVLRAANVPNALATLQQKQGGMERLILYSQEFMMRVKDDTKTDWAALSILAHEIGHHLNGHTLLEGGSRPALELEADEFSGYVLQRMGSSLDHAQTAMKLIGSDAGSATHPPKSARLAAITKGWKEAGPGPQEPPANAETKPVRTAAPQTPTGPVTAPAPQYISRCVFNGDATQYMITATNDIVAITPFGPQVIGRKNPPRFQNFAWTYQTNTVIYDVTPQGQIVMPDQFGRAVQVGSVTNP